MQFVCIVLYIKQKNDLLTKNNSNEGDVLKKRIVDYFLIY